MDLKVALVIKELKEDFKSTSVTIGRPQHHRVINADVNQSVQHFQFVERVSAETPKNCPTSFCVRCFPSSNPNRNRMTVFERSSK